MILNIHFRHYYKMQSLLEKHVNTCVSNIIDEYNILLSKKFNISHDDLNSLLRENNLNETFTKTSTTKDAMLSECMYEFKKGPKKNTCCGIKIKSGTLCTRHKKNDDKKPKKNAPNIRNEFRISRITGEKHLFVDKNNFAYKVIDENKEKPEKTDLCLIGKFEKATNTVKYLNNLSSEEKEECANYSKSRSVKIDSLLIEISDSDETEQSEDDLL